MRREKDHRFRRGRDKPGDCVLEQRAALVAIAVEGVGAVFIEHAHMNMHAVPGHVAERLRHKRRDKTVLRCDAFDCALEKDRLIRRAQDIGLVFQIDFKLAGTGFDNGGIQRQLLRVAGGV